MIKKNLQRAAALLLTFLGLMGCVAENPGNNNAPREFRSPAQVVSFRTGSPSLPEAALQRPTRLSVTEAPGSLRRITTLQQYRGGERLIYQVIDLPGTPSEVVKMETHVVEAGASGEGGYSTVSTDGYTYRRHDRQANLLAYRDYNSNTMLVTPVRDIIPPLPISVDGPVPDLRPFSFPHRNFPSFSYNFTPTITGRESIRLCVGDQCYETIRISVLLSDRASMQIHHETVWLAEGVGIVMWRFRSSFARGIEADRILVTCIREGQQCPTGTANNLM